MFDVAKHLLLVDVKEDGEVGREEVFIEENPVADDVAVEMLRNKFKNLPESMEQKRLTACHGNPGIFGELFTQTDPICRCHTVISGISNLIAKTTLEITTGS